MRAFISLLCSGASLLAQDLVVDRGPASKTPNPQQLERAGKGSFADSFRVGATGEVWMIDSIRVWVVPPKPSCARQPGDQIEKIVLLGALDNPPVPGQPVCDCHALVALATAPLLAGGSTSSNPGVQLQTSGGLWQLDFHNLRWSVPGNLDVLFSLHATSRPKDPCVTAGKWALNTSPAPEGYRLHLLDKLGVPVGLEDENAHPRTMNVQVWAHRVTAQ